VLFIPVLIVALIYKEAHLESWSIYEAGLLLAFQVAIGCVIASLISGHFQTAIMIVVVFGILLAAIAAFTKSLGG